MTSIRIDRRRQALIAIAAAVAAVALGLAIGSAHASAGATGTVQLANGYDDSPG